MSRGRGVRVAEASWSTSGRFLQQWLFLREGAWVGNVGRRGPSVDGAVAAGFRYRPWERSGQFNPPSCGLFSWYFLRTVWGLQRLALGLTKRFLRRGASRNEASFLVGCETQERQSEDRGCGRALGRGLGFLQRRREGPEACGRAPAKA